MRQAIVALLALALAITAVAAPAPTVRQKREYKEPSYPMPGRYLIKWGYSPEKPGELTSYNTGWYQYYEHTKYFFIWEYNGGSRVFTMWETSERSGGLLKMLRDNKSEMTKYTFQFLPDKLATSPYSQSTSLSLKRIR